jgi:hypothetical protein
VSRVIESNKHTEGQQVESRTGNKTEVKGTLRKCSTIMNKVDE